MRVLVTGAGGFVGSHAARQLMERGHEVRLLLRKPLAREWMSDAEVVLGDLGDLPSLRKAVSGVEGVVHCAAKSGIWGPLAEYLENNTMGTNRLLEAARQGGVGRFVYTSSYSVIHSSESLAGIDETRPYTLDPSAPYPYSKMLAERLVLLANNPSFKTVALRPHLVWGPWDPHILPRLVERSRKGRLILFSGGPYMIDATYIDNVALAHRLALEKLDEGAPVDGEVFFIGQDQPQDLNEFINLLLASVNAPLARRTVPPGLGRAAARVLERVCQALGVRREPPSTIFAASQMSASHWSNLDKAKKLLGYEPVVSVAEGLRRLGEAAALHGYAVGGRK
jgi:nucleoside-diphosphate-sugar epimerase